MEAWGARERGGARRREPRGAAVAAASVPPPRAKAPAPRPLRRARGRSHLDLKQDEVLAVVHADDAADHLGHDDHVAEVGAHGLGPAGLVAVGAGLLQLLEQRAVLAGQTAAEAAALASAQQAHELIVALGHGVVHQLLKVDAAEGELAEGAASAVVFSLRGCAMGRGGPSVPRRGGTLRRGRRRARAQAAASAPRE